MQIQVISVSKPEWKEKGRAKWQEINVTYSSGGKTQVKKIMSFAQAIFAKVKEMLDGEVYEVSMSKDENGYWQWTDIQKALATAPTAATNDTKPMQRTSNYETAEERAKKQIYIVRQSSLSVAQQLLAANGGKKNTPEEVIEVAKQFEDYVFGIEIFDPEKPFEDMDSDLPE